MAVSAEWPSLPALSGREADIRLLTETVSEGHCASLVGMSNVGKSFVLRALCRNGLAGTPPPGIFVYVDCNRMVEFTDQGFYELVLRCLKAGLAAAEAPAPLLDRLEQCYGEVIAPSTPFLAHLRFSEAIAAACEDPGPPLILALDEFDQVMQGIDDRVMLNLRALRDNYPEQLCYVTATRRRLGALRRSHGSSEFAELFSQDTYFLAPLAAEAAAALLGEWTATDGLSIEPADVPLIMEETGGHPVLLTAVSEALHRLRSDAQAIGRPLSLAQVREQLDTDNTCQVECQKFWQEMDQDERGLLLQTDVAGGTNPVLWRGLAERHLLRPGEEEAVAFCSLFARYVRRQRIARQMDERGVRVDVEAGEAWVDGRRVPSLTDLEYRLLLLLYGQLDKLVDKYAVVEAVWGQGYIDQVDDARIEKLVSRLRQKIEADPSRPRYLRTVRGRGYKLVSP